MKEYCFEAPNIIFELIFVKFYQEDYLHKIPFNTSLYINVNSFGFCGKSEWIVDYDDLKKFIENLKKLYDNLSGEIQFFDREYGSKLEIKCESRGYFNFTGELISSSFQKLEFNFTLDQTYLKSFVENLYNDFTKN